MKSLSRNSRLAPAWRVALLGLVAAGAVVLGAKLDDLTGHRMWLRPSTAIIIGVVLLARAERRALYALSAVVAQQVAAQVMFGGPLALRLLTGLTVLAQILVTRLLLARDIDWVAGTDDSWRAWRRFGLWAVLLVPLGASVVMGALWYGMLGEPFLTTTVAWASASAVAIAIVVPMFVRWRVVVHAWRRARRWGDVALMLAFSAVATGIFMQPSLLWVFALFPLLAGIVFRGGIPLAGVAIVALAIVVAATTTLSHGPFAHNDQTSAAQVFLLITWAGAYLTGGLVHDRQHGMKQALTNQALFRLLADNAGDIVFLCNLRGECTYVSTSVSAVLGYAQQQYLGRGWLRIVHPDDVPRVTPPDDPAAQMGGTNASTYRVRHQDGHYIVIESVWRVCSELDPNGDIQLVGTSRDVSRRQRIEDELRHAKEVMALAMEVGRVAIWEVDIANSRYRSTSMHDAGDVGTPDGESASLESWFAQLHPADRDATRAAWERAVSEGGRFHLDYRRCDGDGQTRHISSHGLVERDACGLALRAIGTSVDQTEQRALTATLSYQKEALAIAMDAGGVGFWQIDFERGQALWDARIHELYRDADNDYRAGVAPGEWGGSLEDYQTKVLSPEDRALLEAQMAEVVAGTRDDIGGDIRVRLRSGESRWLRTAARLSRGADGRFTGMLGVNWDITAERELNDNLQCAKRAADDANRAKSEFLANMSHEIRTPMNGVLGMVDLALRTKLDAEQRDFLETIQTSAESLLTIIDDVLDFSKIEAGKLDIVRAPFELRKVVARMLKPLAMRANERGLAIEVLVDDDVPAVVVADWNRINQVLVNLIGNAVKFTERGRVGLRIDYAPGLLRCRVADTGIGIAPDIQRRIFAPFEQADGAITRRYGGTGLGLAISSRLAAMMEGRLTVESEPGRGSTFTFEVPVARGEEVAPRPAPTRPKTRAMSVLVAEDNIINQRIVQLMLEHHGHRVSVVGNGLEVLAAIDRARFDVVLMDIDMPLLDGLATTARIRERERAGAQHLPIIALTAHAVDAVRERIVAAGVDGYLTKPLNNDALIGALTSYAVDPTQTSAAQ